MNSIMNWVTFKENGGKFCVFVMYCADNVAMPRYNCGNSTYICHLD